MSIEYDWQIKVFKLVSESDCYAVVFYGEAVLLAVGFFSGQRTYSDSNRNMLFFRHYNYYNI